MYSWRVCLFAVGNCTAFKCKGRGNVAKIKVALSIRTQLSLSILPLFPNQ
jgi:hypothetical protein